MRLAAVALVLLPMCLSARTRCAAQGFHDPASPDARHSTAEWANVAEHLPDITTASAAKLELTGDVLRARRYQSDAMMFYTAAMERGGDPGVLLKKMGITCLEMQQAGVARTYFQRAVQLRRTDESAWNDLGAAEFTLHNVGSAIADYKHALKLARSSAVFHSNLALAYFEDGSAVKGRRELARAMQLDPELLHRAQTGGYNAQMLASTRYSEICFEMARIYAAQGDVEVMLDWLTKASDRGYDVRAAMDRDAGLRPFLADARVLTILQNTKQLRAGAVVPAKPPALDSAAR